MSDPVLQAFLERQFETGLSLHKSTDLLDLAPLPAPPPHAPFPPHRYVATFLCRGLVRDDSGTPREANRFAVGIRFGSDYLRRADPYQVLTMLGPAFHPNIRHRFICVGRISAGTSLVDLLYQVFEILTFQKMNLNDPLDESASSWSRRHLHRLPVDERPFKYRYPRESS